MATRRSSRRISRRPAPAGAGRLCSCALAALALLAPGGARASDLRLAVEAGASVRSWEYAEYGPTGVRLDREHGAIPGASAALRVERGPWLGGLSVAGGAGALRYDGRTQSANVAFDGLPISTWSDARLVSAEALAGGWIRGGPIAAYGAVAWRAWWRDIRPTTVTSAAGATAQVSGLSERYRWVELAAGARWAAVRARGLEVDLDARALATVLGEVTVETGSAPVLSLAPRPGGRLAVLARQALGARWYLAAEAWGGVRAFGASAVDVRSGMHEPDSVTWTAGVEARVGFRL